MAKHEGMFSMRPLAWDGLPLWVASEMALSLKGCDENVLFLLKEGR